MYEELIKALRLCVKYNKATDALMNASQAADAIEELRQTAEHYKGCSDDWYREACDYKAMIPRWIPVTERLPERVDDDVLVTDGEGCAVGFWREDAKAWDSTDFGWLENRSEPPCGIHTVTHWMPLPPLPKEET